MISKTTTGLPKIDVHCHIYPNEYLHLLRSYGQVYRDARRGISFIVESRREKQISIAIRDEMWDINLRLKMMQRLGIDFSVLSIGNPWLNCIPQNDSKKVARLVNSMLRDIVKDYPGKFAAIGVLPLNDPGKIGDEIDFAVDELGMRGFMIPTQVRGRTTICKDYIQIFQECSRKRVPLYIHPWVGPEIARLYEQSDIASILFPAETSLAARKVLGLNLLDRFPNLSVILSHLGGTLPFIVGRIEREVEPLSFKRETGILSYFKRFFLDSIIYNLPAFKLATDIWGADKILFGTDFPYAWSNRYDKTVSIVERSGNSKSERESIFSKNAISLFDLSV